MNISTSSTTIIGVMYCLSKKDSFKLRLSFFRSRELALRSWALLMTWFKFLSLLSSISNDSVMILLTSSNSSLSFSMFSFACASLNSFLFLFICFSKSDYTCITYRTWWRHTSYQWLQFYSESQHCQSRRCSLIRTGMPPGLHSGKEMPTSKGTFCPPKLSI